MRIAANKLEIAIADFVLLMIGLQLVFESSYGSLGEHQFCVEGFKGGR